MNKTPVTAAIVGCGLIHDFNQLAKRIRAHTHIIAADGGLNHCIKMKIRPELVIGDMDSVSEELLHEFHDLAIEKYPQEKNETDLELAIQTAIDWGVDQMTIYGACGNRLDHTLFNIQLMRRYPDKIKMETESEISFIVNHDRTLSCEKGQTISFIPVGEPIQSVSSEGLKWKLSDEVFKRGSASISNICLDSSVSISLKKGELLCSLIY
jgi:thiamine pyrophosphokinase